jgi:hypothetical protein
MTDVTYNGKEVTKLDILDLGDYVSFKVHTKDGSIYNTWNLKGEI